MSIGKLSIGIFTLKKKENWSSEKCNNLPEATVWFRDKEISNEGFPVFSFDSAES